MYKNKSWLHRLACKLRYALFLLFAASFQGMAQDANSAYLGNGNLKYIDPRIGNVGWLLQPTRPTVQQPNQMIRVYPERNDYIDDQISSFPLTIVSHRLGEVFAMKPWSQKLTADAWKQKQTYDHDLEVTRPWYYS